MVCQKAFSVPEKHGGPGKKEVAILKRVIREEHSKVTFRDPTVVEE